MDVTCERCGTEYEFDETLVSGRGTTVKCTNCGHLFKVFRPDADGSSARAWSVKTADGAVRKLSSLKELQRLITAGSLTEQDLIARGTEEYKRLGDIAELSTFFAAAVVGNADTDVGLGRERKGTSPGMAAAVTAPERGPRPAAPMPRDVPAPDAHRSEPLRAPPPRQRKSTMLGVGSQPPSQPPPRPEPPRRAAPSNQPIPAAPRVPREAASPPRRAVPQPPRTPAPPAPSRPPSHRPPAHPAKPPSERPLYIDDDEPVVPVRGRSRSGLWVALVVLVAAAVGVALGWPQIAPMLGLGEEPVQENPAAAHLDPGDEALAEDTITSYEQALHQYTQALAFDDHSVETLTRMSRAHALWAQALAFDADDLEAMGEDDPARRGEANAIRREQTRHAETALARAEDAVRYGNSNAAAEVALSDALRLTGDLDRSRSRLNRALTFESEADAETLRVQALVTAAEADGALSAARDLAEEAVAEDPRLVRARLLYARALLASGDVSAARSQVEAILRHQERHPRAVKIRDAIEEGRPPAPSTVEVPDGGTAAADPAADPPSEPSEPAAPTEPAEPREAPSSGRRGSRGGSEPRGGGGRAPSGRDYSWYVRRGDELLSRGNVSGAREHYDAARALRPGGSEALNGLGNCRLQQGDASGAAANFRQAAGQGYGAAYIGLGRAYRRLGRNGDALASFERYLQRMPSGPHASLARRQVEELRRVTGGGGGGGGGGGTQAPPRDETQLPPPNGAQTPPPEDVPAIDSEP